MKKTKLIKETENTVSTTDTSEIIETKSELSDDLTANITSNSINYSGEVNITVKKGKRTLYSRTSHNIGGSKLFEFIIYCLAGNYPQANHLIPNKIMLFYNSAATPKTASDTSGNITKSKFKFKETNATIENITTDALAPQWKITLHFRIPYSWIDSGNINTICLYGDDIELSDEDKNTGSLGNYSARYFCVSGDNWDPINTSEADTNLIIDWSLIIANK